MVSPNGQSLDAILAQNVTICGEEVTAAFTSFKHHKENTPEVRDIQVTQVGVCPAKMLQGYTQLRPGSWDVAYLC